MKKLFAIVMVVAISLLCCMPADAKKKKADIKFAEYEYNFGNIRAEGGPVSHEFTFTNTGDGNLVISDVTAQCGCTRPEYTDAPIAPGKSGIIKVTYNPIDRGAFKKSVTVKSNAQNRKVVLKIAGTVIPKKK